MQVAKWGNSLAVRLPKALVQALKLKVGDHVQVVAADAGKLEIARDDSRERALEAIRARRWSLPADYRFDREEANRR